MKETLLEADEWLLLLIPFVIIISLKVMEEWAKLYIPFSVCYFYFFVYNLFLITSERLHWCLSLIWQLWELDMICFIDITMYWKQAKIMETFSIFIRGMIVIDVRFPT